MEVALVPNLDHLKFLVGNSVAIKKENWMR
jgi:hypothetical protein